MRTFCQLCPRLRLQVLALEHAVLSLMSRCEAAQRFHAGYACVPRPAGASMATAQQPCYRGHSTLFISCSSACGIRFAASPDTWTISPRWQASTAAAKLSTPCLAGACLPYTVQAGDSCWSLQIARLLSQQALQASNPSINCNKLQASSFLVSAQSHASCFLREAS